MVEEATRIWTRISLVVQVDFSQRCLTVTTNGHMLFTPQSRHTSNKIELRDLLDQNHNVYSLCIPNYRNLLAVALLQMRNAQLICSCLHSRNVLEIRVLAFYGVFHVRHNRILKELFDKSHSKPRKGICAENDSWVGGKHQSRGIQAVWIT